MKAKVLAVGTVFVDSNGGEHVVAEVLDGGLTGKPMYRLRGPDGAVGEHAFSVKQIKRFNWRLKPAEVKRRGKTKAAAKDAVVEPVVDCPACGKKRPLGHGACPACGHVEGDKAQEETVQDGPTDLGAPPVHVPEAAHSAACALLEALGLPVEQALALARHVPAWVKAATRGPRKRGEASALAIAERVLREAGKPLHARELTDLVLAAGWVTRGVTPWSTISAQIGRDIQVKGEASHFRREGGAFSAA